jgi:hypothetical protein
MLLTASERLEAFPEKVLLPQQNIIFPLIKAFSSHKSYTASPFQLSASYIISNLCYKTWRGVGVSVASLKGFYDVKDHRILLSSFPSVGMGIKVRPLLYSCINPGNFRAFSELVAKNSAFS